MNFLKSKTKNLNVRISEIDLAYIKSQAGQAQMSISDFIVAKCKEQVITTVVVKPQRQSGTQEYGLTPYC